MNTDKLGNIVNIGDTVITHDGAHIKLGTIIYLYEIGVSIKLVHKLNPVFRNKNNFIKT